MHALTASMLQSPSFTLSGDHTVVSGVYSTYISGTSGDDLTLPASPVTGETVAFVNKATSGYCLLKPNGKNLDGSSANFPLLPGEFSIVQYDGTAWYTIAGTGRSSIRKLTGFAPVAISNSVTETTIVDYTVPGGLMNASGCIEWWMQGYCLNNSGASRGIRGRLYVGGSSVYDDNSTNIGASATVRANPPIHFAFRNTGATNTNIAHFGGCGIASETAVPSVGSGTGFNGSGSGAPVAVECRSAALTQDTTADFAIKLTVTLSTNSVNFTWNCMGGNLIYIPG